jgi:hypothetical protein
VIAAQRAPADRRFDAAVLAGSCLYLCANLFALSGTPFLLGGDQALFWTNAQRLLHGELIYRDFLEFTPPGTDLIYLGLFRVLGSRIWVPNLVVLLLGVALCWLCFRIARSIMRPAQAALAAALFMVLDYGRMLNATHHWFSVLAVMAAVAVLLEARTPARIALAGTLLGVAAFFTQTRGPIAALGIGVYLLWDRAQEQRPWSSCLRDELLLFLPLLAAWGALSSYFIATVGFWRLWYFQVTYVLRYVTSGPNDLSIGSPQGRAWLETSSGILFLLVFFTLPVVYALSLRRARPRGPADAAAADTRRIMLLTVVGAAMFLEVAPSPNWIRVYCVAIPGLILLVRLLSAALTAPSRTVAMSLMWTGLAGLLAYQTGSRHLHQPVSADLPAGRIMTAAPTAEKLQWLARHTMPGERFFEARWVDLYMPLALRNPVFTDMLEGGHNSRPEFVDLSIRQLQAQPVQYIVWAPRLESPAYPFARFHDFLVERYQRVLRFPDQDEVWELRR